MTTLSKIQYMCFSGITVSVFILVGGLISDTDKTIKLGGGMWLGWTTIFMVSMIHDALKKKP